MDIASLVVPMALQSWGSVLILIQIHIMRRITLSRLCHQDVQNIFRRWKIGNNVTSDVVVNPHYAGNAWDQTSNLDVSIEPNELFNLSKNNTHYVLKCCAKEQCISIRLRFNETSPSKKFYLPVRDFQSGNIIEKSARIIHKKKGDICGSAPTHAKIKLPSISSMLEFFSAIAAIAMLAATLAAALVIAVLTA